MCHHSIWPNIVCIKNTTTQFQIQELLLWWLHLLPGKGLWCKVTDWTDCGLWKKQTLRIKVNPKFRLSYYLWNGKETGMLEWKLKTQVLQIFYKYYFTVHSARHPFWIFELQPTSSSTTLLTMPHESNFLITIKKLYKKRYFLKLIT